MNTKSLPTYNKLVSYCLLVLFLLSAFISEAQMRQMSVDNIEPDNEIYKISFYSPSGGYIAYRDWIGFTSDSGHTITKKYITLSNVDYNGYFGVNLTFGFGISGVKAFNQNTLVVYGDYGLVPAILYSTNGGNNFKLIYHSQFSATELRTGIMDMIFPQNNAIGYAVDADRILKTTDQGQTWTTVRTDPGSYFEHLEAVDNNNVYALSEDFYNSKLLKTSNAGTNWQVVNKPAGQIRSAYFLTPSKAWISVYDNSAGKLYATTNGGTSWILQNDPQLVSFTFEKMKFLNDSTGYAIGDEVFTVYKTTTNGRIWEALPRDNNFSYLGYSHNDIHFMGTNQFWAGGGHGFLEMTTNGGGTPVPKALFKIDTTNLLATGIVNLTNYSRPVYTYQWYKDETLIGTGYHASYTHNPFELRDTIKLVVSNGTYSDTSVQYVYFNPPVVVTSFTPTSGGVGTVVMIKGLNFTGANAVSFGGSSASFTVLSDTSIRAGVGSGATGSVAVRTPTGFGSLPGFTFIPPPVITSFTPTSAIAGATITINGNNFNGTTNVKIGGVNASYVEVSPTTIRAIAPSGPSGVVSVTATGGTVTLAGFVSIPVISSFSPLKGTFGTYLVINGTSLNNVTAVTVGGIPVQSFTINSSDKITAIVAAGGSGNVVVSAPGGSSSLAGFSWFPPPVITSFSPVSGPVGTTVTITGMNFHATPSENTVFFGTIKANVTAGTTGSLTVTVPVGATFEPISVITNNLIAYSKQPFVVTFPGGNSITSNSYPVRTEVSVGSGNTPHNVSLGDVDGDGKLDLILVNLNTYVINNSIAIMRNTSSGSVVSFAAPVHFAIPDPQFVAVGDVDGDGKHDFAVTNRDDNRLSVFKSTSTPGTISFAAPLVITTQTGPEGVAIGDIDGDGKPDIATTNSIGASIYRNIGDPGNLAFAPPSNFAFASGNLIMSDIDLDGKPELLSAHWNTNVIVIAKNTSIKGTISFAASSYMSARSPYYVVTGDMDGDGYPDLVTTDIVGFKAIIYRNNGSSGGFAQGVEFDAGSAPSGVAVNDLDGDGKLDIAFSQIDYNLSVLKNTSSSGNISFAPKVDYSPGRFLGDNAIAIGDVNGDNKPDPVVVAEMQRAVSVFISNVQPEPFILSFTPTLGVAGTVVTITGNNFTGVTSVSFGDVPAASFTVNSSTKITATVGNGAAGNIKVTNAFGTASVAGFAFGNPPVITSITPASGAAGSSVTIAGSNFNAVPENNIVYFGGVRAVVTNASTGSLTVIVPPGNTPQFISVTTNNLTAYSSRQFVVTFAGASANFSSASFAPRFDRTTGGTGSLADMDGDGKLDLVLSRGTGISVALNTGTTGSISFAANVASAPTGSSVGVNEVADFDGDGKKDVVVINGEAENTLSILRNTCTPGVISFATKVDYLLGPSTTRPSGIACMDMDGDGKIDLMVANYYSGTVAVFRNISTVGNISFAPRVDFGTDGYPTGVVNADIDGDGKPDMIASVNGPNEVSVWRNTSVPGTISFALKKDFPAGTWPNSIDHTDLDGDGKIDLFVANSNSSNLSLFHNISVPGNILFEAKQDVPAGGAARQASAGDLDGDGKPDIAAVAGSPARLVLYKNTSVPGTISVAAKVDYSLGNDSFKGSMGDMDGDGIIDMVCYVLGGTTSIFRNLAGSGVVMPYCTNSNVSLTSNVAGTTYQWQQNNGTGFANIADNSNFSGTNTMILQLSNIPASWNGYEYKCIVDGTQSSVRFRLSNNGTVVTPDVIISTPNTNICTGASATFKATPLNGGTAPSYQWQVNGLNTGINSDTVSINNLSNGAIVRVILTSNAVCASPAKDTSNTIVMTIKTAVVPSVSIVAFPAVACPGKPVRFTASTINGGNSPAFQWKKNGVNAGTNDSIYVASSLQTGDTINVVLTSNASCAAPSTVASNRITMTVSTTVSGNPQISISGEDTVIEGQTTLVITNTTNPGSSPTFEWQDSTGTHGWQTIAGAQGVSLNYQPSLSGDRIRCIVTSNAVCVDQPKDTSNVLIFTVTKLTAIDPVPASRYNIRLYPNPAISTLIIDSLKISDRWYSLEIVNANGGRHYPSMIIVNQSIITVDVSNLSAGLYFVILRKKSGESAYLKFVKQH